ncbi:MAG: hypothetical protein JSS43_15240 [Proteobacteria bacterium]|nr:hypothetical protein [Pseudomonadota bacterium]
MDAGTFIVRIVEAIAWPVTAGLIFWKLRGRVGDLIDSIQRLKWKDTELTFGKQLDRVEAERPPAPVVEADENAPQLEQIAAEAQLPPAYIVQQAWLRIERVIDEATKSRASTSETSAGRTLNYARRMQALNLAPDDAALLRELRALRNEAVHSAQPNITVTDALRYKDLAESLARRIELGL